MVSIIDSSSATRQVRDFGPAEDFTVLTPAALPFIVSPGTSPTATTLGHANVISSTGATTRTYTNIQAQIPLGGWQRSRVTYSSDNSAIATINGNGKVTPVGAGTCNITVTVPGIGTRIIPLTVTQSTGQTTVTFTSWETNSLEQHIINQVNALTAGKASPGFTVNALGPFSWTPTGNIFMPDGMTRNPNVWTGSVDLTAIPVAFTGARNGFLIGPETMAFASHFGVSSARFIDNSGNAYTRTVVGSRRLDLAPYNLNPFGAGDICVAHLSSPLPAAIKPFKIAPANIRSKLASASTQYGNRCIYTNQDRTLCIQAMNQIQSTSDASNILVNPDPDPALTTWSYNDRDLDSGSPTMVLVNGALVVISHSHYGQEGPIYSDWISTINQAIADCGSPDQLTLADWSAFPT